MKLFEKTLEKKGMGLGALSGVAVTLVVAGIVIALGLNIMGETKDEFTSGSAEYNATADAVDGIAKLSNKLPLIGLAVAAVIVIGVIVGAFGGRKQ